MTKANSSIDKILLVIAGILGVVLIISVSAAISVSNKQLKKSSCENEGKKYVESTDTCRDMTISESFDAKCDSNIVYTISGKTFSCSDFKKMGLENAFLNDKIIKHGDNYYERGTSEEIAAGKQVGDYCLSAQESWSHIGEKRCVVFRYEYLACSNGYCFLDEKKDYNSGFVAFFGRYNMYNWSSFSAEYQSGVYNILVCGQIYTYRGHPEIKITDVGRQVVKNPNMRDGAYAYTCN